MSSTTEHLGDHIWEDHLDLIRQYAPKGLETVSASWMTPENIQYLSFSLDDLNILFLDFIGVIDHALDTDDDALQIKISEFLDDTIRRILFDWLTLSRPEFLIYPMREEHENEFTDLQFMRLIQALLTYSKRRSAEIQASLPLPRKEEEPSAPVVPPTEDEEFHDIAPETAPEAAPAAAPSPLELPTPPQPPVEPSVPVRSVAAALKHRRTMRRHGARANRGKTLRSSRIRQKTRKVSLPLG